jgi:putative membrane protein
MAPYFAFLHHLAAFTLFAALVVELILIKDELTLSSARKIQLADMAYGIAAGSVIVIGLLRVFYFEKGAEYYIHSVPFFIKMTAFILVGALSILPTIEFLSWSKFLKTGRLPAITSKKIHLIRRLIHIELVGVVIIILAAALMAKGFGYTG